MQKIVQALCIIHGMVLPKADANHNPVPTVTQISCEALHITSNFPPNPLC